jgi:hypothetical protein
VRDSRVLRERMEVHSLMQDILVSVRVIIIVMHGMRVVIIRVTVGLVLHLILLSVRIITMDAIVVLGLKMVRLFVHLWLVS